MRLPGGANAYPAYKIHGVATQRNTPHKNHIFLAVIYT